MRKRFVRYIIVQKSYDKAQKSFKKKKHKFIVQFNLI